MANSEAEAAWKFCVVDFEVNGVQLVGTVSENWMTSCDDEVWYPPSSIKGRKLSKYITEHQTPEEDWIKYECSLLKICGKPHYFFFPCYYDPYLNLNNIFSDSYDTAQKFEKRKAANADSELLTEKEESFKRKRKQPDRFTPSPTGPNRKKAQYASSDSSDDNLVGIENIILQLNDSNSELASTPLEETEPIPTGNNLTSFNY